MDDKSKEIIEKSSVIFLKNGIRSVTMDDLAGELGMSKKTFYNYFKDKDDLIMNIVMASIEQNRVACIGAHSNSETAIDALFNISEFATRLFTEIHSSVFYDMRKYHPESWKIVENHRLGFVNDQIFQNMERGQKEGIYIQDLDPQFMTKIYLSIVTMITDGDLFDEEVKNYGNLLKEIVSFQLRGIVNDKGRELMVKYMKNK